MPEKQRPKAGAAPSGAVYRFLPDWKEHVSGHLANARGILQADGCKGNAKLYQPEPGGVPRLRGKVDQTAFLWKDGPTNAC